MQIFIVLMKNEEKCINYHLLNPMQLQPSSMCRAGSGLGRRVLDSVFIFQMVMMKTRKIHEFFSDRFTQQNTNFKSV